VPEVYVDRPPRRWIAWGELILRVFKQDPQTCPGCGGRMRQVALVLAASGDVLRWLDDERVLPTGLPRAAWFCLGRGRAETHRRRRRFGDGAGRGRTSTGSYGAVTAKA
jgi:hypothetical protein